LHTKEIIISASILSANYGKLTEQAVEAEKGGSQTIHIDIMDGHYVHNFSFGLDVFPTLKKQLSIPLVAHLEIEKPDYFIQDFADVGADMIVVQEDTCPHLPRTIENILKTGVKAGIGINPDRGFEKLEANPEILQKIDLLIVMAVYPGFGGQPFSPVTIPKIKKAVDMRHKYKCNFDIGVDGGVSIKTVENIVKAGGNYLIAGSSIFGNKNLEKKEIHQNINELKKVAQNALAGDELFYV